MQLARDEAEQHFDEETWHYVCDLEEASGTDLEFYQDKDYTLRFDDCDGLFIGVGASLPEAWEDLKDKLGAFHESANAEASAVN